MPAFVTDFNNPAAYTVSNSNNIEVAGGLAKNKIILPTSNVTFSAYYSSSVNAEYSAGDNTGSAFGGAAVSGGFLDLTGNLNKYVDYDANLNADSAQVGAFRIGFVPNYSGSPSNIKYLFLVTKQDSSLDNLITLRHSQTGNLEFLIIDENGTVLISSNFGIWSPVAGVEYELELNYDLNLGEHRLFINGSQKGITLTATGIRDDTNIGLLRLGRAPAAATPANHKYNYIQIFNQVQHVANYTPSGAINLYSTDPTWVYKTAGNSDIIVSWQGFSQTLGIGNTGNWGYQLSIDGLDWKYWNGAAWVSDGTSNYNTASTVNSNINSFPIVPGVIYVRAFSITDGFQQTELDTINIIYESNQEPFVYAGIDKSVNQELSLKPFSDASFSDPDGTITNVFYKVDGEVDIWTEILQGGYGTLLEAVQNFEYLYSNIGNIITRLKVRDNNSAESEDSLIVTVNKYIVTFTVSDKFGFNQIGINFLAGDGSSLQEGLTSPFIHEYEYHSSNLTAIIDKAGYNTVNVTIIQGISSYSITLVPTTPSLYDNMFIDDVVYSNNVLTSARIRIYSNALAVGTDSDVIEEFAVTATEINRMMQTYKTTRIIL